MKECGIREAVRDRYAASARAFDLKAKTSGGCDPGGCGCSTTSCCDSSDVWGQALYDTESRDLAPEAALLASLGCGNPTAVAELKEGETVLDLGSGAGLDVLLSARRVGPTGKAFGLDMTEEMLARAVENKAKAGLENVEFLKGYIEDIPLPAKAADVVISNCVVNLSADKDRVFRESFRVLRPGGRLGITDVVSERAPARRLKNGQDLDADSWCACLEGALTRDQYEDGLRRAGFIDVEVRNSHSVGEGYASAIIKARKPLRPSSEGGDS